MIQAKELRVGNKIYSADKDNILTVEEIRYTTVRVSYIRLDTKQPHVSISHFEDFNPIPLTPEILEQCGFEKAVENAGRLVCWKKSKLTIAKWIEGKWQCWLGTVDIRKSPQSLHQLQNLYFALTGEELQINL